MRQRQLFRADSDEASFLCFAREQRIFRNGCGVLLHKCSCHNTSVSQARMLSVMHYGKS